MMSHGSPNQFFTGFTPAGVSANTTAMSEQQGSHIAYIIKETLARGAATVEPSQQAQDEWVRIIRETSITDRNFWRECTPGYYNNEGEEAFRSHLGEPYGPGFYAFDRYCKNGATRALWRASSSGHDLQSAAALPLRSSNGDRSTPAVETRAFRSGAGPRDNAVGRFRSFGHARPTPCHSLFILIYPFGRGPHHGAGGAGCPRDQ
jgi:hypothetical protein